MADANDGAGAATSPEAEAQPGPKRGSFSFGISPKHKTRFGGEFRNHRRTTIVALSSWHPLELERLRFFPLESGAVYWAMMIERVYLLLAMFSSRLALIRGIGLTSVVCMRVVCGV